MNPRELVLASSSPRRRQLLTEYGYRFTVQPATVDEVAPAHLTVAETTLFNAKLKAMEVARCHPEALVIGVDTLVSLDGLPIGKPLDLGDAFCMLSRLSNRVHEVYSSIWAVCLATGRCRAAIEVSHVKFRPLDEAEIRRYLARIEPLDKAGAYAAQDESPESVVERIDGSRTNVVGLPMEAFGALLDGWD
jgi:septum formation protein